MPWTPLPRIAFAVATYPFSAESPADLPLELGDELYIIEQGGKNQDWYRGYLVAPPSLLAGLTSVKGQTLEARVFSGIFPRSCVEVREVLGEEEEGSVVEIENGEAGDGNEEGDEAREDVVRQSSTTSRRRGSGKRNSMLNRSSEGRPGSGAQGKNKKRLTNGTVVSTSTAIRDPDAPKPPAPVPLLKIGDETPTSNSEPLVDEIASCLREWHSTNLHELMLSRQYSSLDKMAKLVQALDFGRRQFLHNVLTGSELEKLREKTVWDLVRGNKTFSGEVIVRDPEQRGRVLTADDSAVEITNLQSMMSLLEERPAAPIPDNLTLHHLLVDVKAFVSSSSEATTLEFYLASKAPGLSPIALSESYIVDVHPSVDLNSISKTGHMRTLFTDLAASDIGDLPGTDNDLYVIVKVRSTHQVVSGRPKSRGELLSRDGLMSSNGGVPPKSSGAGKAGRRSMMWGQNTKRSAFSRNAPITSKLDSLSESGESHATTDENYPPNTAESRGPPAGERKASSSISRIVAKTVAIGAIKVNQVFKQVEDVEGVINIWQPATGFGFEDQDQDNWEEIIKDLMESKSGFFEKSRKGEHVQLQLRGFDSPDAESLVKSTPTLLSGVTRTSKMGFSGAPTKPRSDIYITIDEAFLPRHALLSRSTGSATPMSSSIVGSHLQITLEVRKANGDRLEGNIFSSSNADNSSSWESTATERGEGWRQTLKLCIPPAEVSTCHVVMTLADVPNQPFAICHMPLWDQQAFIRDGHHSLLLYRYDETTHTAKGKGEGKGGYLHLSWSARGKDDVGKDEAITGPIATLRLQTYLCSTRFSQDKNLLGLLKWKEQTRPELQELLKRLVFVPEIEIVKLLNDVFDAIFGVLVENSGVDEYEDLVFSALVTVLGIVHDRRFNLGPLVDQYAEHKFNYPFATPCLVRSFTRLLSNPSDANTSRKLNATFKVVRHILKFITHARGQQKVKEADIGITSTSPGFTRHLRSIFKALEGLMRNTSPSLVGTQTLAVQHFHTWLPELSGMLETEEIVHIAIDFLDACALVKGRMILYKLVLIINYSKLDLFSQPDQRSALSANTVRWIAPHWGNPMTELTDQWVEQVRLCCSILSTQISGLGPEIPDYIPKIIESYLALQNRPKKPKTKLSLLFPTTYPFPSKPITSETRFEEVLVELSAVLSAISTAPAGMQLELSECDDEMATLLQKILRVHLSILQCEAFPANWLSVHIYHHKSTLRTLEYLSRILLDSYLPEPDDAENYNTDLWKLFFTVLLQLIGSDALALETFPEQKRRAVWKIAGDVRSQGADLLRRTWEAIGWDTSPEEKQRYGLVKMGGYQVQYVPVLVGPIVELCLSVHEGLRCVAVEVLRTMIVSEWTLSEDLSAVQTEMIDCLDRLFKSKPLTESILRKLFISELIYLFEPLSQFPDDPLDNVVRELVGTIDEFLDLLVAVHSKDITGEASHMIHRLRLMEFLRDMQKEEIFIRYVHQLAQLQAESRNPTEAGLALRLHADLYEWDPTKSVPPLHDPEFPAQSQFDRKERIYFDIIKYFEEGEAWSSALSAYQELQQQYISNVYDFPKLVRTQRAIATIYETIAKSDKSVPKYFRVAYRGMGFPPSLRDKEFVFEASANERTSAFTDHMQEMYPIAQIVTSGDVDIVEGQYLQISPLSPHRDLESHVFQRARVPLVVRDYLLSVQPQKFSVTSKRTTAGHVSEHTAEKTVYTTAEAFPTILKRSEIVAVDKMKLSALQTAVERVTRKTQEIAAVEKRVANGEDEMVPLLIDSLQISVNPTSDTSIAKYRALLPTTLQQEQQQQNSESEDVEGGEGVEEEEPVLSPLENALWVALIDHAVMVKRCLSMLGKTEHSNMCADAERELLVQNFHVQYAPELHSYAFPQIVIQPDSPTPVPSWQIASPVLSDSSKSGVPASGRNGSMSSHTQGTDILDTPGARAGRNRLSFLMGKGHNKKRSESVAVLAPVTNYNGVNREPRGRGKNSVGSLESDEPISLQRSRSKSKENGGSGNSRHSFFGGGGSMARMRAGSKGTQEGIEEEDGNENDGSGADWVTGSDFSTPNGNTRTVGHTKQHNGSESGNGWDRTTFGGSRRSSSSVRRPVTGKSSKSNSRNNFSVKETDSEMGGSVVSGVGSRVGSVRKRLSILGGLGLNRKKSRGLEGSVVEEE